MVLFLHVNTKQFSLLTLRESVSQRIFFGGLLLEDYNFIIENLAEV